MVAAAAANLSRTGGIRLLSSCTRPLLLFTSTSHSHSHSNSLFLNHPNYYNPKSYKFSLTNASLSLSLSSSPKSTTRVYCTTSPNVAAAEDSSSSSAPSSSDISDESVKTTTTIKDVANTLEIKVGKILKAWRHEEADSLFVEEVDVGEAEPRIICSGLVKYMPLDHLQDKKVVVLANLKARNMRGVKSYGMLMAASDASHENVELLAPPEGSLPGERVWFGSADELENLPDTASPNQVQKKKIWESVQPHLKTDASCVAALEGVHIMRTSAGVVVSPSLKDGNIS